MNEQTHEIKGNHLCLSLPCCLPSILPFLLLLGIEWVYWFSFSLDESSFFFFKVAQRNSSDSPDLISETECRARKYQICLLPEVSRSSPQSLVFFFLKVSFVMETALKSHCDEQHPHQAEDISRKHEQNSKLSGMC